MSLTSLTSLMNAPRRPLARTRTNQAAMRRDMVKVFVTEQFDATADAHGRGIAERTEKLAQHIVADVGQQLDVALFAVPCSRRSRSWTSQYVPSRQGVHLPHDSSR